jgi:pimeloyl-ACP methyl ester carboxylesterase
MRLQPFSLPVDRAAIDDLHHRLDHSRWGDASSGWAWGTDPDTLRTLVDHWRHRFDWRRTAAHLDTVLPSSIAQVGGMQVHSAFRKGKGPNPFPLVLMHGWPSSFAEMIILADRLADPAAHGGDPADAFDVVVPSLPGHCFSESTLRPDFGADDAATIIRTLMTDVYGYDRFGAHGGDRGAFVSASLGALHADVTAGIHITFPWGLAADPPTADDRAWWKQQADFMADEGGYIAIQSTRAQTLGYALNDSPIGLLAWIVEKWRAWSDCGGDLLAAFTPEQILTNASIYWFTQTIRPSMQWYGAHRVAPPAIVRPTRIACPTGVAVFPKEVVQIPRSAVERKFQLARWTEMPRGGHFAQMEEPRLLAEDIRAFFRDLR